MYCVIGLDGHEYGPVDLDTLKAWTGAGRVHWDTEIHDRTSDRWCRAGDMKEIRPLMQQVPPLPDELEARQAVRPLPQEEAQQAVMPITSVNIPQSPPTHPASIQTAKPKPDISLLVIIAGVFLTIAMVVIASRIGPP